MRLLYAGQIMICDKYEKREVVENINRLSPERYIKYDLTLV